MKTLLYLEYYKNKYDNGQKGQTEKERIEEKEYGMQIDLRKGRRRRLGKVDRKMGSKRKDEKGRWKRGR